MAGAGGRKKWVGRSGKEGVGRKEWVGHRGWVREGIGGSGLEDGFETEVEVSLMRRYRASSTRDLV